MSKRLQTYSKLPEDLKEVYSSDRTLKIQSRIIAKYSIKNEDSYIDTVGDTILGFYTTSELPVLLQKEVGVSADDAIRIMGDLQELLTHVLTQEKTEANPNRAELQELQQTLTPQPTVSAASPIQTEDAAVKSIPSPVLQETHTPVQSMRTMEGDMSRVHGYGAYRAQFPEEPQEVEHTEEVIRSASQHDLLQEKPKLAGMPTYKEKE